jgi:hypothetical protein
MRWQEASVPVRAWCIGRDGGSGSSIAPCMGREGALGPALARQHDPSPTPSLQMHGAGDDTESPSRPVHGARIHPHTPAGCHFPAPAAPGTPTAWAETNANGNLCKIPTDEAEEEPRMTRMARMKAFASESHPCHPGHPWLKIRAIPVIGHFAEVSGGALFPRVSAFAPGPIRQRHDGKFQRSPLPKLSTSCITRAFYAFSFSPYGTYRPAHHQ